MSLTALPCQFPVPLHLWMPISPTPRRGSPTPLAGEGLFSLAPRGEGLGGLLPSILGPLTSDFTATQATHPPPRCVNTFLLAGSHGIWRLAHRAPITCRAANKQPRL